jgi:hypothetical protein
VKPTKKNSETKERLDDRFQLRFQLISVGESRNRGTASDFDEWLGRKMLAQLSENGGNYVNFGNV